MTTASGDSHHRPPLLRRHRCLLISLVVIVLLIVLILILCFTLFRSHDPTTELIYARVNGVSPSISAPAIRISLNLSLFVQIRVHNPNRASFSHSAGTAHLYYNSAEVGDALVEPGRIPSKGSEILSWELTVQADKIAGVLTKLIGDIAAGEVGFDSKTRLPGRLKFLGRFKHQAVALSECHVVIGFPHIMVKSRAC